jgi:hypothetical protein
MAFPKFTAEATLGKSVRTYRGKYLNGGPSESGSAMSVLPTQEMGIESPLGDGSEAQAMGIEDLLVYGGLTELTGTEALLGAGGEAQPMGVEGLLGAGGEAQPMNGAGTGVPYCNCGGSA